VIRSPDVTVLERVFPIKRVYVYIHVYIYRVETGIDSSTSSLGDEIDTISAVFSHEWNAAIFSDIRFAFQLSCF